MLQAVMAKAVTINIQHSEEVLIQEIKTTSDGRYRLRVQTILLLIQRQDTESIHKQLMISKTAIFSWLKKYNKEGLEGLQNITKGGRKEGNPKWDNKVFEALFAKLDSMEEFWSVPKMAEWMKDEFNVEVPERTIHHRLKVNGYTFKSSRPNPYKGDPNLQAAFKKTES